MYLIQLKTLHVDGKLEYAEIIKPFEKEKKEEEKIICSWPYLNQIYDAELCCKTFR